MADPLGLGSAIHNAVEAELNDRADVDGVVVSLGVVVDIANTDGDRKLVDLYVTNGGEDVLPHWIAKGLLQDALDQYDRTRGRSG